jgi:hypothetical protein
MLFANPCEPYTVDPVLARALEVILILHMDHEQNASTSTVRTAGPPRSPSPPSGEPLSLPTRLSLRAHPLNVFHTCTSSTSRTPPRPLSGLQVHPLPPLHPLGRPSPPCVLFQAPLTLFVAVMLPFVTLSTVVFLRACWEPIPLWDPPPLAVPFRLPFSRSFISAH